uniref:Uncharacterized protein n=1 Tax=Siphoviridae sp. ctevH2 TaxID=2825593 RepID=A0A8S5UAN6_9CAUD|nr:MAG TPA: hypothetical protein [Siphoviridae sp. ctevH2]
MVVGFVGAHGCLKIAEEPRARRSEPVTRSGC